MDGVVLRIAEREIRRVRWAEYRCLHGEASSVGSALEAFLRAGPDDAWTTYWSLENCVVAQSDVYSVAEPVVSVLVAVLLDERPKHVRVASLDLLYLILSGGAAPGESPSLIEACAFRAREGFWVLVREALWGSEAAMDVVRLLEGQERVEELMRP